MAGGRATLPKAALVLGVAAFVGLLLYGVLSQAPDTGIDQALAESRPAEAPLFELPVMSNEESAPSIEAAADGTISLAELRGRPVVLNFWASWCVPCRAEAPVLEDAWEAHRDDGVLVLGLNRQDLTGDAQEFVDEFELTYPNVRDATDEVAPEWGVAAMPETFFLSAEGEVVGHVIGDVSERQLEAGIEAAESGTPIGTAVGGESRAAE